MDQSVNNQPKQPSSINRNSVNHQPKPQCRASAEATHRRGAREGNRTLDLLITSEPLCRLSYPGGVVRVADSTRSHPDGRRRHRPHSRRGDRTLARAVARGVGHARPSPRGAHARLGHREAARSGGRGRVGVVAQPAARLPSRRPPRDDGARRSARRATDGRAGRGRCTPRRKPAREPSIAGWVLRSTMSVMSAPSSCSSSCCANAEVSISSRW